MALSNYEATLKVARRKHDIIPVVIADPREAVMPNVGLVRLKDEETGEVIHLDTASRKNRDLFASLYRQQTEARDNLFRRLHVGPPHRSFLKDWTCAYCHNLRDPARFLEPPM